jgi:radical SAM protein (TIGR01212 family)
MESAAGAPIFFSDGSRYNAFGPFLREKFGCRVRKVIVDAGFTCPNRDGTLAFGGCTYCNNDSFRPESARRPRPIRQQIEEGIRQLQGRFDAHKFIAYFQPFSNTHAPLEKLIPLYEEALAHQDVVGLAVGTRPDCVDDRKITWFERLAQTHFVTLEYGLESIYDGTLERINRGHGYQCWLDAMELSRGRGIWLCTHLILGFPWESRPEILAMARALGDLGINSLKLHHFHVVERTVLGAEYQKAPFPLLQYEEYRDLVVDFLELLAPSIRLERLFAQAPRNLLLGPIWDKSKAEIQSGIERELERRNTYQGRLYGG